MAGAGQMAPPDPAMMGPETGMPGMDQGMMGPQPGSSTDPAAILQALAAMAESDQQQLAMSQAIEQQQLEEEQKVAIMQALQAMLAQLGQDAHVLAGPSAADEMPVGEPEPMGPEMMGGPEAMGPPEAIPGVRRMVGQPIPDEFDIPA